MTVPSQFEGEGTHSLVGIERTGKFFSNILFAIEEARIIKKAGKICM
jgi:hypothetical protein